MRSGRCAGGGFTTGGKRAAGGTGANQHKEQRDQNEPAANRTAETVANELGVSPATVKRDGKFATAVETLAENLGDEVKTYILSGKSGLTKQAVVEIAAKEPEEQAEALAVAKAASKASGPAVATDLDRLLEQIDSLNLHRRHLNPSQLSMVGARAREVYDASAKERQQVRKGKQAGASVESLPQLDSGKARDAVGRAVNVSGKLIDAASPPGWGYNRC
ncbi:MAG: hypothetical protein WD872_16075 [Pirellulaceae bacterium]